jgi:hypothetical protein
VTILFVGTVDLSFWRILTLRQSEAILSISAAFVKTTMTYHSLRAIVASGPHGDPDRNQLEASLLEIRNHREGKPQSSFSILVNSRPAATNYTDDLLGELSQSGQETHFQFQA